MTAPGVDGLGQFIPAAGTTALLGSALIGGTFFAFSSFVMKALAQVPAAEGVAVMQSINVVVLNRSFLGVFFGTAVLSLGIGGFALAGWGPSWAFDFLAGALFYLVGTFLVTMLGNVPLNDQLATVVVPEPSSGQIWEQYLARWTLLNHLRTAAAMAAALFYCLGLLKYGGR